MALTDYGELIDRMQKSLAKAIVGSPATLNLPGVSAAQRMDQNYFMVLMPGFVRYIAGLAGTFPESAHEALLRTGGLIIDPARHEDSLVLRVTWPDARGKVYDLRVGFLMADFVDRAMTLYGGGAPVIGLSPIRISPLERGRVQAFLKGKTPLSDMAFASQTARR